MNKYIVYQHINTIKDEVFYIGSGRLERAYQVSPQQRSITWNLYVKNNKLRPAQDGSKAPVKAFFATGKVKVEILKEFSVMDEAYEYAVSLIESVYGTPRYKLANTIMKEHNVKEHYKRIAAKASVILARAVINLVDNQRYKSSAEAARILERNIRTVNTQCNHNHKRLLRFEDTLKSTKNGMFIYEDDLGLYQKIVKTYENIKK